MDTAPELLPLLEVKVTPPPYAKSFEEDVSLMAPPVL